MRADQYNLDTARFFPTLEDALSRAAADAVIIVTPPDTHRDLSIKAMQAGLHVLSEKPLADSMAAAQDILDASRQTGMLHVVTQNYRYFEQAQTLKAILDSGEMGAVSAVHVSFFKGWPGWKVTMSFGSLGVE